MVIALAVALVVGLSVGYLLGTQSSRDVTVKIEPNLGPIDAITSVRIDAAKWSEGKAIMGTIATAIRAYYAEAGPSGKLPVDNNFRELGFMPGDLDGVYFTEDMFEFSVTSLKPLRYTITGTNYDLKPNRMMLNQDGKWLEK